MLWIKTNTNTHENNLINIKIILLLNYYFLFQLMNENEIVINEINIIVNNNIENSNSIINNIDNYDINNDNNFNVNTSLNFIGLGDKSFDLKNSEINLSKLKSKILFEDNTIFSMTFLSDNRLVIGGKYGKIYIFSLDLKNKFLIQIPLDAIVNQLLLLTSKKLLAMASDKNIYIYNIINNEFNLDQTIVTPSIIYKVIEIKDEKLVSIHQNNSLRGYVKNNFNYQIECTWKKNYEDTEILFNNIFGLKNKNKFIATSYVEDKLFFINSGTYEIKNNLNINSSYSINNIQLLNDNYILVGGDLNIYLIDINKEIVETSIETKGTVMTFFVLNENCFLSGEEEENYGFSNLNKYEIIYDNKKKKKKEEIKLNLLETLNNVHDDIIRNIVLYQNKAIITSGEDNKVKLWDFN